jgi:zinc/manganese transport system substrate-binding protein
MKKIISILSFLVSSFAFAATQVATTTTDLAAIVQKVGGDQVEVFSIGKGTQDPHQIEAKPSFMVKLRDTKIVMAQGLELESAWLTPLIQGSRNTSLNEKGGVFELGPLLDPIEIPQGQISRIEGDVHPGGNPHFQLDPIRLGKAAVLIAQRFSEIDPIHKDLFMKNAETFQKQMNQKTQEWKTRIQKTGIKELVTYHKTFSYFCDRFELKCQVQLEPKPGIPPTTSHLLDVIDQMKKRKLRVVLIENLYDDSVEGKLKQDIPDVFVRRVPVSVGGESQITTNEELIEKLVKTLEEAGH